jgi:hypothetical protein
VPPAGAALTADWIVRNAAVRHDLSLAYGCALGETYRTRLPCVAGAADAVEACTAIAVPASNGAASAQASLTNRLDLI